MISAPDRRLAVSLIDEARAAVVPEPAEGRATQAVLCGAGHHRPHLATLDPGRRCAR